MAETIIVGYVPTLEGEAALNYAIFEATAHNSTIIVVNASRNDSFIDANKAENPKLEGIKRRLTDAKIPHRVSTPQVGLDAASQILEVSEQYSESLIVLGLRRRSKVGKLLLGSTAQTILTESNRPVLCVRAE